MAVQIILVAAATVAALVVLPVVQWGLRWWRTYSWLRNSPVPGPPPSSLFAGHADTLVSDKVVTNLAAWTAKYGPIFKLQLLNELIIMVTDPDTVAHLLRKPSDTYLPKSRELYAELEFGTKPHTANIVTASDGAYWKALRQGIAPCFSITNLKHVFPRLQALTRTAADVVTATAGGEVDVADIAKRITSDVMGSMLLDQDFGGMDMRPDPYMQIFRRMLEAIHRFTTNPLRGWAVWDAQVRWDKVDLDLHDQMLGGKMAAAMKQVPPEHTIAGHLLKVRDPATGKPLNQSQLKANLGIVLAAGFETTSHAITWTLAALATHPDVQSKLVCELSSAGLVGPGARQFEWGDVARLPYLNAVIKESLRVFTPIPLGTWRVAHKPLKLMGYDVPKGAWVVVPLAALGTSPRNYGPTAHLFDPERWLTGSDYSCGSSSGKLSTADEQVGKAPPAAAAAGSGLGSDTSSTKTGAAAAPAATAAPAAAAATAAPAAAAGQPDLPDPLSFSLGPRDCVGQSLARLELQVVVASLVAAAEWSPGQRLGEVLRGEQQQQQQMVEQQQQEQQEDETGLGKARGKGVAQAAAAAEAGVAAIKACAVSHITLQPQGGSLWLKATPRGS